MPEIVLQIEGKRKAEKKLPELAGTRGIIFPPKLNLEQSSSEQTARFKASLLSGSTLMDLTGGFGIDTIAFSKVFEEVVYVERNKELTEIVRHNLNVLHISNVQVKVGDLKEVIGSTAVPDVYYLDPARRIDSKKIVSLKDCEPNVLLLLPQLIRARQVLIKTSPMLDISKALEDLSQVSQVMVVSVENECKEVLYLLEGNFEGEPQIKTFNLTRNGVEKFDFIYSEERSCSLKLSEPLKYLYEPNASILKAGAFKSIALKFGLDKLHRNSHLYTSQALIPGFPGRSFAIKNIVKYSKEATKSAIPDLKANVTTRNFPDSVEVVRRKTGIKEGGDVYVFATVLTNNKPALIITEKINESR
ncbi:MAG TPA: SAM-dependent methyltransferase [Cytophagaceae bacterium]